ncbi:MAG: NADH-quinone oxidoreductase subunit I, partial [Phycisphaerales bacterium]
MAIRDSEILDVTPTKLNRTESLYVVNVFKGLGTTLRHCFQNIGRNGANKDTLWVLQYPEQRREQRDVEDGGVYKPYFRGVHRLNKDEDGRVRCVACFMCQT